MAKFKLKSGKYTSPYGKKCNYYYIVNENGEIINYKTLRPYKGKKMKVYAMASKTEAMEYLKVINKEF